MTRRAQAEDAGAFCIGSSLAANLFFAILVKGTEDVSAFMFGARTGFSVSGGKGHVTFWYDYLARDGDPDDGKAKVFDTLFATNHKYYGFADLFLNVPAHTGGFGLQDAAIKTRMAIHKDISLSVDIHSFWAATKGGLSSRRLGEELDLTLTYRYSKEVSIVGAFPRSLLEIRSVISED